MNDLELELRVRIIDKFTAEELVEMLELSVEQIFDAFTDEIFECADLLEDMGFRLVED